MRFFFGQPFNSLLLEDMLKTQGQAEAHDSLMGVNDADAHVNPDSDDENELTNELPGGDLKDEL